ncbi:helix-turn-helix transcriptional regulator [Paraburkholderia phymatum]|uniref:helix-turn-helix domain-containing protein n=1 Tax=Paraburkholderia phymatum TaxID=148447 RepID=UPI00316D0523
MTSTFGSRLLEERDRLGLTQTNICEWTDINRRTQSAYEKDQRYPDARYLMTLLEHDFDVSYLLTAKRTSRYGAIDIELLCSVLTAIEACLQSTNCALDVNSKARLCSLIYQASSETGSVDPLVVQKAIDLLA